jgi:O-antigen ligase
MSLIPVSAYGEGRTLSYVPTVVAYSVFGLWTIAIRSQILTLNKKVLMAYITLSIVYLSRGFYIISFDDGGLSLLLRSLALVISLGFNLLIIPQCISIREFLQALSRLCLFLMLVGVVGIFVDLGFSPFAARNLPYFTEKFSVFTSAIVNVNASARILGFGFVASIILYNISQRKVDLVVSLLLFLFVVSTAGRSAIIASSAAAVLFTLLRRNRRLSTKTWFFSTIIGGIAIVSLSTVLTLYNIPLPITFSQRNIYWAAAVEIMIDNPVFGIGPGDTTTVIAEYVDEKPRSSHNTFLRTFVTTGLVGGIAFSYIIYRAFRQATPTLSTASSKWYSEAKLVLLYYTFTELMLSGFSLIGFRFTSIVAAISIGMIINPRGLR